MNNLPQRKTIRLNDYDYNKSGVYFLTICVKNRHEMLGKIFVGDGVLDVPQMRLTEYGVIADKYINSFDKIYENISIDKYVIIPNHIHVINSVQKIGNGTSETTGNGTSRTPGNGTSRTPSPTNAVIPFLVSTFKRFTNKEYGFSMYQRSYHDHIIRNKNEYLKIWKYIDTNPLNWERDCFFIKSMV